MYKVWINFGCFFFFKQKTAYEIRISYLSSYVCSSDLALTRGERFAEKVDRLLLVRPKLDHARPPRITSKRVRSSSCALPSLLTNSLLPDRTPSPPPPPPPRCKSFVPTFVLRSYPRRSFRMDTAARAFLLFSRTYNHSFIRRFCQMRPRRSEEHTSELQSLMRISYAVFCLHITNIQL